jgi:hypothetical protein
MWSPLQHFRPNKDKDAEQMRTIRDGLARNMETSKGSRVAGAFLSRKPQEPFPQEDEAIRIDRWLGSKEL